MRYFKGKQFKKDIILVAVGYYCRFSLSYRDVSEILQERGVSVHPTTIMRWVHEYGNLIYQIWKKKNKTTHRAWHLDETYIKVKGDWCYLYRAIDEAEHTLDIQLRKTRDHQAAYMFRVLVQKLRDNCNESINLGHTNTITLERVRDWYGTGKCIQMEALSTEYYFVNGKMVPTVQPQFS
ncbi:IS6 family transposase [Bacillus sp. C1]